jgi:hypothetical protein
MKTDLLPLPKPVAHMTFRQSLTGDAPARVPLFTADQMRAYRAARGAQGEPAGDKRAVADSLMWLESALGCFDWDEPQREAATLALNAARCALKGQP